MLCRRILFGGAEITGSILSLILRHAPAWRITLAVVSRISCGFRTWTYSASMVRSTISAPVRVMLSRVDFFEASICIDSVLEMASKGATETVDQFLRVDDRAGRVLHLLFAE